MEYMTIHFMHEKKRNEKGSYSNDTTMMLNQGDKATYFHTKTPRHDIIVANQGTLFVFAIRQKKIRTK